MTLLEAIRAFLPWWACSLILALAAWPILFLCLKRLPDRGLAFARIFGLLLTGYLFWLGCWLHLWPNIPGAVWLCAAAVFCVGSLLAIRAGENPWTWLREHWREALAVECLYLVLFAALAWILAYTPGADHTEAPMDLAFVNAILRSTYFPPNDPWLSGYAISYYHFGYVLAAMQAKIAGLPGGIAFFLSLASTFALACTGAYGLLRNLLLLKFGQTKKPLPIAEKTTPEAPWRKIPNPALPRFLFLSLLAPFTLLLLGNLEGFLDILYYQRVGWQDGQGIFWKWLDLETNGSNRITPPNGPTNLLEHREWWWWQASRVINDRDLSGAHIETIDEFPAFSFIIGDMHPHVMAMPFLLLALAVAFETLLRHGGADPAPPWERWLFLLFSAFVVGSLLFINTWDVLVFGLVAGAGWVGWQLSGRELTFGPFSDWKAYLARWAVTGLAAVALFAPSLIGFASQVSGIIPNVLFPTKGNQYFVTLGTLFIPILAWVLLESFGRGAKPDWRKAASIVGTCLALTVAASLAIAFVISLNPDVMASIASVFGGIVPMKAISLVLIRRITDPLATLLPAGLILAGAALILGWIRDASAKRVEEPIAENVPPDGRLATVFALLLVLWGALLVLFPEYFYLKDFFGSRYNTLFKFYFQNWTVWSLPAAFGFIVLLQEVLDRSEKNYTRWSLSLIGLIASAAVFILGALFLPIAVWTRTNGFEPYGGPSLDATAYFERIHPDDAAAIAWMRINIEDAGPIAEAMGNDFDEYASRVATQTGIPNILGWIGHEDQWRGGGLEMGSRKDDIPELFRTTSWARAEEILNQYGIRYVYFGPLELQTYGTLGLAKFKDHLKIIYQTDKVFIFEVSAQPYEKT